MFCLKVEKVKWRRPNLCGRNSHFSALSRKDFVRINAQGMGQNLRRCYWCWTNWNSDYCGKPGFGCMWWLSSKMRIENTRHGRPAGFGFRTFQRLWQGKTVKMFRFFTKFVPKDRKHENMACSSWSGWGFAFRCHLAASRNQMKTFWIPLMFLT